eukprot:1712722-Rhodomonas_salina.1
MEFLVQFGQVFNSARAPNPQGEHPSRHVHPTRMLSPRCSPTWRAALTKGGEEGGKRESVRKGRRGGRKEERARREKGGKEGGVRACWGGRR